MIKFHNYLIQDRFCKTANFRGDFRKINNIEDMKEAIGEAILKLYLKINNSIIKKLGKYVPINILL